MREDLFSDKSQRWSRYSFPPRFRLLGCSTFSAPRVGLTRFKYICDVMQLVREANEACRRKRERAREKKTFPPKTRKVRRKPEQEACYRGRRERRKRYRAVDWVGLGWRLGREGGNLFLLSFSHMISSPQEHEGDEPGRQLQTERKER